MRLVCSACAGCRIKCLLVKPIKDKISGYVHFDTSRQEQIHRFSQIMIVWHMSRMVKSCPDFYAIGDASAGVVRGSGRRFTRVPSLASVVTVQGVYNCSAIDIV